MPATGAGKFAIAASVLLVVIGAWISHSSTHGIVLPRTPLQVPAGRSIPDARNPMVDCAHAFSPTETLLCSDDELKLVESEMGAAYARKWRNMPAGKADAFVRDHVAWYSDYVEKCDAIGGGEMLKKCIFEHLSYRTHELDGSVVSHQSSVVSHQFDA